jgi:sugar phosphate isomerase/epimerase
MNRRRFFESSALALGASALRLQAAQPNAVFPTDARARLAVASWPFRKLVDPKTGTMKLVDFPAFISERFGVSGIEPLSGHFPSTEASYLREFRAALGKAKMHVVNIPVNPKGSLYDPDEARRQQAVATARHWVDVALAIGSPSLRVSVERAHGAKPDAARAAESLKIIAGYGEQKNVVINLENDDPESEDAFFLIDVIQRVRSSYLRALPDFCNSMVEKHGDAAFNYAAVKAMLAHAYNISHVKAAGSDGPALYQVDLAKTFKVAKEAGFRGYYSMEFDQEGDPLAGTKFLVEQSLKYLA